MVARSAAELTEIPGSSLQPWLLGLVALILPKVLEPIW
jgi:hypothetical protein